MDQREVGFSRHLPIAYARFGAARDCSRTAPALRPWAVLFLRRLLLSRAAVRFARHRKCSDPAMRKAAIRAAARGTEPPTPLVDFSWQDLFYLWMFFW